MHYFIQILLNGTHTGALYALLAFGYMLTYQVTRRANIAHGAIFAFSGQNLILFTAFGWNTLWLIFPLALAFGLAMAAFLSMIAAMMLAKIVFPPLIDKSPNAMIAATLGVAICLMELARLGAGTRDYWLPQFFASPIMLGGRMGGTLTQIQVLNLLVIASILALSEFVLRRTKAGRHLRAVSDEPFAAELLGIDKTAVTSIAIVAGSSFAIIGGFLAAMYFGNIGFGSGLVFGLKVLFIASAGGFSNPLKAAGGAFLFGLAEALWDGYFPIVYRDAVVYAGLALLLILRSEEEKVTSLRL